MITILLNLLIAAIIIGLIVWLAGQIPFLQPYARIIQVVGITLFVLYVIYVLAGLLGHPITAVK